MASITLIPLARPTFDLAIAQSNFDAARELLREFGAEIFGPEKFIMSPDDVAATKIESTDYYILFMATFSDASPALELLSEVKGPILLWSVREPGGIGERLKLNSMCGANLAAHALIGAGQTVRHLHGNPEESSVKSAIQSLLKGRFPNDRAPQHIEREFGEKIQVENALKNLAGRRIGAVGDAPVGFTPCTYDAARIKTLFGIHVDQITMEEAFNRINRVAVRDAERAHASAVKAQPSLGSVNEEQAVKVARAEVALDEWREELDLDALAIRCWPEFPTDLGACVCSALGRIADRGTVTTCERDVLGAITMLVCEALGSDENYLVDIVDLQGDEGLIRLWHCGSAATKLAADPKNATQYTHCNRKLGVAGNFPLKTGPVILVRIDRDVDPKNPSGLRMIVSRGESIPAPNQFQGNTATVRTEPDAATLVNGIVTRGYPHHLVISWIDVRPGLRLVAKQLGIPLVEW